MKSHGRRCGIILKQNTYAGLDDIEDLPCLIESENSV